MDSNTISILKEDDFSSEKELHSMIENNIKSLLGIRLIRGEFRLANGERIDTLGIDTKCSPVVVEYKLKADRGVVTQSIAYLDGLEKEKERFELLVEKIDPKLKVKWSNLKLIIIAKEFNNKDITTAQNLNKKGYNIQLMEYDYLINSILIVKNMIPTKNEKNIDNGIKVKTPQGEYSLDIHLSKMDINTKEIFYDLKKRIEGIGEDVIENIRKSFVSYNTKQRFIRINFHKKHLSIYIRADKTLKDPKGFTEDVPKGMNFVFEKRFKLEKKSEIPHVIPLIKQSYQFVDKNY